MTRHRDTAFPLAVISLLAALLLGACLPSSGSSSDEVAEYFPDTTAQDLASAVLADNPDEVTALLEGGARTDVQGRNGLTMLQWAVTRDSHAALVALLDGGADPNQTGDGGDTAMHLAAFSSEPAHLVSLLEFGGDSNVRGEVTGRTPLDKAVLNNNDEPLRILLAAGADPNMTNRNGDTALHTAARTNKGWAILLMLETGGVPIPEGSRETSWQDFYWGYNPEILNDRALAERREVIAWLEEHGHEVHPDAEQFRGDL